MKTCTLPELEVFIAQAKADGWDGTSAVLFAAWLGQKVLDLEKQVEDNFYLGLD